MIFTQTSFSILSLQTPFILSSLVILSLSKDEVLSQCNSQSFTSVILNSSKDGVFIEDNLQRIPQHFDKLSMTVKFRKLQILNKLMRIEL